CNSRAAVRLYQERFPNRRVSHRGVFSNISAKMDRPMWPISVARQKYGLNSFRFLF
ncbi:unnamed protein product, partial [Tenebrio molitor]